MARTDDLADPHQSGLTEGVLGGLLARSFMIGVASDGGAGDPDLDGRLDEVPVVGEVPVALEVLLAASRASCSVRREADQLTGVPQFPCLAVRRHAVLLPTGVAHPARAMRASLATG